MSDQRARGGAAAVNKNDHPWRRRSGLALVVALAVAVVPNAVSDAARAAVEPACSIFWTGAASDDWSAVGNWNADDAGTPAGRRPGPNDTVCMASAPTRADATLSDRAVITTLDWPSTQSVTPTLTIDSGDLTTTSAQVPSQLATLRLIGTLRGASTFIVSGSTTFAESATTFENFGEIAGSERLVMQGRATMQASYGLGLYGTATVENSGTFAMAGDAVIGQDGDSGNTVINDADATITYTADPSSFRGSITAGHVVNDGRIVAAAGAFALDAATGVQSGGSLRTLGRAALGLEGSWSLTGGKVTGAGELVMGGTTVLDGLAKVDQPVVLRGELTVRQAVTLPSLAVRYGDPQALGNGSSDIRIDGSSTLTVLGAYRADTYSTLAGDVTLLTRGPSTIDDDATVAMADTSTWENAGDLTMRAGGAVQSATAGRGTLRNDTGSTIVYDGTVTEFGNSPIGHLAPRSLVNRGSISAIAGTLGLSGLTNLREHVLTGGTYAVSNGADLVLGDTVSTNAALLRLDSGGLIASRGRVNALTSLATNNGKLDVDRGKPLTLNGPLTNAGVLQLAGNGPGSLSVGSYRPSPGGRLEVAVSGADGSATSYGQLTVQTDAALDGALYIATRHGYLPPLGTVYRIVSSSQPPTGTFTRVTGADVADRSYRVDYDATGVTLTVVARS